MVPFVIDRKDDHVILCDAEDGYVTNIRFDIPQDGGSGSNRAEVQSRNRPETNSALGLSLILAEI